MADAEPTDARAERAPLEEGLAALRHHAGRAARALRRGAEALLHPLRRRKARERARQLRGVPRVVTVCLGNICRSPYAEAALRRHLAGNGLAAVEVRSAGLIGPGRPVPPEALAAAGALAPDLRPHISQLVSPELVRRGDLIIVMSAGMATEVFHRLGYRTWALVLGDLDPMGAEGRTIVDPWGGPPELFQRTFRRIDRCLQALVEEWTGP